MTDARPSLSMGTLLGGRYRIERPLGAGAMGSVYAAVQDGLGRKVAIKVLHGNLAADQDAVARFHREAQAAAALGHPNIVQVIDFLWPQGEPPFLVMEHLEGRALSDAIRGAGRLDSTRISRIARQVTSALEAAHAAGIIHRDIKPDNIFLTEVPGVGEVAKVLDFGIAKLARPTDAQLTGDNTMLGSPAYMAPEQARGGALDHRADIFSLGSTMYVALSGRLPFDAQSLNALLFAITEQAPPPIAQIAPGTDPRMIAVVERAMQKDPRARFQSAAEMRAALESIVNNVVAPPVVAVPGQSSAAYSAPPVPTWNGPPMAQAATSPPPMMGPPMAMQQPVFVPQQKSGGGAGLIIGIVLGVFVLLLVGSGVAGYVVYTRSGVTGPVDVSPSASVLANGDVPGSPSSIASGNVVSGNVPGALMPKNGKPVAGHDAGLGAPSFPGGPPGLPTVTPSSNPGTPSGPVSPSGPAVPGAPHGPPMSGLDSLRCTGGAYGNFPNAFANINANIGVVRPCYATLQYTPPNHEFVVFRFQVGKDGKVQRFLGGPEGTERMPALDACVGSAVMRINFGKSQNGQDGEVTIDLQARAPGNE